MMQIRQMIKLFDKWSEPYLDNKMTLKYESTVKIGFGSTDSERQEIVIGIKPFGNRLIASFQQIPDKYFVKAGIVLFHELTHHIQNTDNTPKDIQMSMLSKHGNPHYYYHNHQAMLHEIDAEYNGIMTMWDRLDELYPDKADRLMLEHLTGRAADTVYMIGLPKEGFQSREQVEALFEQAYDNASRELPPGFLRSDDETARMLTTKDRVLRPEYVPVYNKLTAAGDQMDEMMASLVSHIHPELQDTYLNIDFKGLEPSHIFKVQMPETSEEIRDRLGMDDGFAKAVESLETKDAGPML